ncbi:hypothetical protein KFU94_12460 [Chloroflexi bacterium TSY]|nr:hypothetical protein [Chloroflexi bacterium TSY]
MRKKKEKQVEKRYYRPTKKRCPNCKSKLKRSYKLWHKYLETLEGRYYVVSHGYRCQNENCLQQEVVYRSQEAEELGVPECGYGLDVIVEIGYQRFWHQRRVAEIHKGLKERITISERQVLNLIGTFLALLRAGQPAKVVNQQKNGKGWAD